jgi:DeoR family transcriptional regulator, ulaG and ulaABCDEF operon transcriptional repressor
VAEKRAIADAAAALLRPNESVIIGGGSTTFCLADALAGAELDILTNSFPLAAQLMQGRHRVTLPGGTIYREQSIVLSPFECEVTRHFLGSKILLSCFGLNGFGLMENDPLIVQSTTRLIAQAENVVVLADSRKFRRRSSTIVIPLARVDTIVTDSNATPEELEPFRSAGVRIVVADVPEEAASDAA